MPKSFRHLQIGSDAIWIKECWSNLSKGDFHDYIEKFMQIYIDDIVIKSVSGNGHLDHLRKSFERMKKHGLKMNPLKCAFYM